MIEEFEKKISDALEYSSGIYDQEYDHMDKNLLEKILLSLPEDLLNKARLRPNKMFFSGSFLLKTILSEKIEANDIDVFIAANSFESIGDIEVEKLSSTTDKYDGLKWISAIFDDNRYSKKIQYIILNGFDKDDKEDKDCFKTILDNFDFNCVKNIVFYNGVKFVGIHHKRALSDLKNKILSYDDNCWFDVENFSKRMNKYFQKGFNIDEECYSKVNSITLKNKNTLDIDLKQIVDNLRNQLSDNEFFKLLLEKILSIGKGSSGISGFSGFSGSGGISGMSGFSGSSKLMPLGSIVKKL